MPARIKELLEAETLRDIHSKDDEDAHFGHKTITITFYEYINHLARTAENLKCRHQCNRRRGTRQELPRLTDREIKGKRNSGNRNHMGYDMSVKRI